MTVDEQEFSGASKLIVTNFEYRRLVLPVELFKLRSLCIRNLPEDLAGRRFSLEGSHSKTLHWFAFEEALDVKVSACPRETNVMLAQPKMKEIVRSKVGQMPGDLLKLSFVDPVRVQRCSRDLG